MEPVEAVLLFGCTSHAATDKSSDNRYSQLTFMTVFSPQSLCRVYNDLLLSEINNENLSAMQTIFGHC